MNAKACTQERDSSKLTDVTIEKEQRVGSIEAILAGSKRKARARMVGNCTTSTRVSTLTSSTNFLRSELPLTFPHDCPMSKGGGWVFLQDNDPRHKSGSTTAFLDQIAPDRILDHPPSRPDFGIMKGLWPYLDEVARDKWTKLMFSLM